jgi:hypothetical protein
MVMLITGYWEEGAMADQCVTQMRIGIEDLFYKLDHGYMNYSNGGGSGPDYMTDEGHDYYMTKSLWYDVTVLYHDGELGTTAKAGPDQTVTDDDLTGSEVVQLDGSASNAGPGLTLTGYLWTEGATVLGTTPIISVPLAVGMHSITLEVADNAAGTDDDTVVVTVELPALVAIAGPDQTLVDTDGVGYAIIRLDGSLSFARDTTITNYVWTDSQGGLVAMGATPTTVMLVGDHIITLTITDSASAQDTDTVVISVQQAIGGDCDLDGDVDLDDFVILKSNFGRDDAGWGDGDSDGDGDVDLDDFVILKGNFGL